MAYSSRETPGPIPNPEAKPANADGTATGRLWESKKPPAPNKTNNSIHNKERPLKHYCFNGLSLFVLRFSPSPHNNKRGGGPSINPLMAPLNHLRCCASSRLNPTSKDTQKYRPESTGRGLRSLRAAAAKPLRGSSEAADCLPDDLRALAESKAHLALPRFRVVREGG